MAYGGWQAAVPQSGKNLDASWHYVEWASNPENSGQAAVTGGSGVNPYRFSHFTDLDRWLKTFSPEEAKMYLAAQRGSLEAPNIALDMRLPGYFSYTEELEIELSKALSGRGFAEGGPRCHCREMERPDGRVRPRRATCGLSFLDGTAAALTQRG